ncbi:unnamed protein product [Penicillium salamii]|nr:unnamed protein product [Penicillium salamii]
MPFWFLPPDFTFSKDGAIRLGAVIEHPLRPLSILASEGNGLPADIDLPAKCSIVERGHEHSRGAERSVGMNLWATFLELASSTMEASVELARNRDFGKVDHEVLMFNRELGDKCLKRIMAVPKVRKYVDSGFFGRKPVYIITGVRVTNDSFDVSTRSNATVSAQTSASASDPTGTVPITAGTGGNARITSTADDSYETAPGIVFAYRVHIIRTKGDGEVGEELFSHKKAFMTGPHGPDLECIEVNPEMLRQDPDEPLEVHSQSLGDEIEWASVPISSART